jgi:hypothetical protein
LEQTDLENRLHLQTNEDYPNTGFRRIIRRIAMMIANTQTAIAVSRNHVAASMLKPIPVNIAT